MAMELGYGYHYASLVRKDAKYGCNFLSKYCLLMSPKERKEKKRKTKTKTGYIKGTRS